jgi:hypothetical protein
VVVSLIRPLSRSMAVLWMVAISCWPRHLRTMSSPVESEARRNVRWPSRGNGDSMVAVSDFSGLAISACALASAVARAPILWLDRCMARLLTRDVKADRPRLRALGANPMT